MHYGCQLVKRDFKHLKDHAAVIRSVTSFLCVSGLLFRTMTGPLREWCCCSVDIKNFNKIPHKVACVDLSPFSTLVVTYERCGDAKGKERNSIYSFLLSCQ